MKESHIDAHLVDRVEATGGLIRKIGYIGRRACPDRLCGWPNGKHGLVETKPPRGKARAEQAREHERLRLIGIRVDVLDTIEAVDEYVKDMRK